MTGHSVRSSTSSHGFGLRLGWAAIKEVPYRRMWLSRRLPPSICLSYPLLQSDGAVVPVLQQLIRIRMKGGLLLAL